MKTFQCDHCKVPIYYENIRCLGCGSTLGIIPGSYEVHAVVEGKTGALVGSDGSKYRFCRNSIAYGCCNQLVAEGDPSDICRSCRFTEVTPDLTFASNRALWARMEQAKRRLLYSLVHLGIPPVPKSEDAVKGLAFRFLVDNGQGILTGHENGVITITLAEADDATREARRQQMGERYRTLLGHFRHEIGHYYWDRLIADGGRQEAFRKVFGDERADYQMALKNHYAKAPDDSWKSRFISRYASSHPWEDWAESFAHFLHMRDVVETSHAVGLIGGKSTPEPKSFAENKDAWLSTSFRLNELGRSMGTGDLYPFVVSDAVILKMEFIHDVIAGAR
ncbi:MAG: putative zinc-binding metallopeptidase [Verrucomicrobiota bacterium]